VINYSCGIEPVLLDRWQAAEFLSIPEDILKNWTNDLRIPHIELFGLLRFSVEDLRKWARRLKREYVDGGEL
jgi:hypothetical protein